MMVAYEFVRFAEPNGPIRAIHLKSPKVRGLFLCGIEVDRNGDEVAGSKFDRRLRAIHLECVRSRKVYVMHPKYAMLVPEGKIKTNNNT